MSVVGQLVERLQLVMPLGPHRGRMIAREQGVPRPKVSAFRPRHNKLSEVILIDLQASVYIGEEHQKLIQPMR